METLLIRAKNKTELQFITEFFKRMQIETKTLSIDDKEDLGLIELMKDADRTQKVSREKVMSKLNQK